MLDNNLKQQLSQYLTLLEGDIEFACCLDGEKPSRDLREFLDDVASLSDRIKVKEVSGPFVPSFEILREGVHSGVVFAGVPLGHEFESFVLALLQVSGRSPKISDEDLARIKSIDEQIHFETVVSLTCHNCPEVVQALNIMAVVNPKISHTMIEGSSFEDLVEDRGILAVPTVFRDGKEFHNGRITLGQLLDKLVGQAEQDFVDEGLFDLIAVGGGPAAATAALYAARKGIKVGLVCEEFGGQVKETLGIENIPSTMYTEGPKYMESMRRQLESLDISIIEGAEAVGFEKEENFKLELANGRILESKTLVLATGARWRQLGVPGEEEFKNKGVAYCTHCDGPLFKGKKIAVIGGGNSGVEAAIDLAGIGREVFILEFADELNADQVLQKRLKTLDNVKIIRSAQTKEIQGDKKVEGLSYVDRVSGQAHELDLDAVFVQIGLIPNNEWIKDKLETNRIGELVVDKAGATNIEGVFAAGDCTDQIFKQIVISEGSGATAALSAFNYLIRN